MRGYTTLEVSYRPKWNSFSITSCKLQLVALDNRSTCFIQFKYNLPHLVPIVQIDPVGWHSTDL